MTPMDSHHMTLVEGQTSKICRIAVIIKHPKRQGKSTSWLTLPKPFVTIAFKLVNPNSSAVAPLRMRQHSEV